jgi:hypothetical protein
MHPVPMLLARKVSLFRSCTESIAQRRLVHASRDSAGATLARALLTEGFTARLEETYHGSVGFFSNFGD